MKSFDRISTILLVMSMICWIIICDFGLLFQIFGFIAFVSAFAFWAHSSNAKKAMKYLKSIIE